MEDKLTWKKPTEDRESGFKVHHRRDDKALVFYLRFFHTTFNSVCMPVIISMLYEPCALVWSCVGDGGWTRLENGIRA